MKKALSIILAVIMLLGCMSVTAFAEEPDDNSTVIKAKKVAELSYEMVIPGTTELDKTNHKNVVLDGKATVKNVKDASIGTRIFYTVDMTNANFADENGHTMQAFYKYAQGGNSADLVAGTTVTVFDGNKIKDSTISVTVSDSEWEKAAPSEYTATLVFSFDDKEVITVGSLLDTVKTPGFPVDNVGDMEYSDMWATDDGRSYIYVNGYTKYVELIDTKFVAQVGPISIAPLNAEVTTTEAGKTYSLNCSILFGNVSITFNMENGHLTSIKATGEDIDESLFKPQVTETIAVSEVLKLSEKTFPTTLLDGWFSDNGVCVGFVDNGGNLVFQGYGDGQWTSVASIPLTANVSHSGNKYSAKTTSQMPIQFKVESGKLIGITAGNIELKPDNMTITSLVRSTWSDSYPTSDSPWNNNNGVELYFGSGSLNLDGLSFPNAKLTKDGNNYKFNIESQLTVLFTMKEGKIGSVTVSDGTGENAKYNGTYEKKLTGNDVIQMYSSSLPKGTSEDDVWTNGYGCYIWYNTQTGKLRTSFFDQNPFDFNLDIVATETADGYSIKSNVKINISDNKITSIELNDCFGYNNDKYDGNGTYKKMLTGNAVIKMYADSLPQSGQNAWTNGYGSYIWYNTQTGKLYCAFNGLNAGDEDLFGGVTETPYGYATIDEYLKIYISGNKITAIEFIGYIGYDNNPNQGNGTYRAQTN